MGQKRSNRPFPWWRYLTLALLIVFLASTPLLSALTAELIAKANGCTLHEGNSHPCHVFGNDIGRLLYQMFVIGWLMLLTLPYGFIALLGLLVALIFHLARHWVQRRS